MKEERLVSFLKNYFEEKEDTYGIEMAFLFGSWAGGRPHKDSDIDVAVTFTNELEDNDAFERISDISLELTGLLKHTTDVIYIDHDLTKPVLYYNAIVCGELVFTRDFTRYVNLRLRAIHQMEDFQLFGRGWQKEIVRKRMEALLHA